MFQWTTEKIRFYSDAAEYLSFSEEIATKILPFLHKEDRLCDAGCGLGYLSMALAPHCREILAVDSSAMALDFLKRHPAKPQNVTPSLGDVFSLPEEEVFDGMIFCLFGEPTEITDCILRHCRRTAFILRREENKHSFSGHTGHRAVISDAFSRLAAESRSFSLEMGQPFRSKEDAERFFAAYGKKKLPPLAKTASAMFPYYYAVRRRLQLLVVDMERIRT